MKGWVEWGILSWVSMAGFWGRCRFMFGAVLLAFWASVLLVSVEAFSFTHRAFRNWPIDFRRLYVYGARRICRILARSGILDFELCSFRESFVDPPVESRENVKKEYRYGAPSAFAAIPHTLLKDRRLSAMAKR